MIDSIEKVAAGAGISSDAEEVSSHSVVEGQAVYNRAVLAVYDWWVLGFSNRLLWKCPTEVLREEFVRLASKNHLDIGVGTGYYLRRCLDEAPRRLALMDLNDNSLAVAAARSNVANLETYRRNVLEPFSLDCDAFDSISMNYLLHCIPGNIPQKLDAVRHAVEYLTPEGILFGSTILSQGVARNSGAKKLMNIYNRKGIFHNAEDNLDGLRHGLNDIFQHVSLTVKGCVAVFSASSPRKIKAT